jgi:hypothetical protein
MTVREVPASAGQRLLWFLDRYRGQSGALNCPMTCRIRGHADEAALQRAIDLLAARHESLRTTFGGGGRQLTQLIHEPAPVPVHWASLEGEGDPQDRLQAALHADLRYPVNPREAAVRVTGWRLGPAERVITLNMHHMVTDTWSCGILLEDLAACYARACGADGREPPSAGWQYAQFARWQERQLRSEAFARHADYWRNQLAGMQSPSLPVAGRGPAGGAQRASAHGLVSGPAGAALRDLARAEETTAFTVLLAAYQAMLHRLTGQDDIAVATLFTNRVRPEVLRTVGFVANMVMLRTRLPAQASFTDLIRRSRQTVIDAFAHQELAYHLLAQGGQRPGQLRPDDIVFQLLARPLDTVIEAAGVTFEGIVPDVPGRFDFELALMPASDGYAVKLYYSADRVATAWAEDFVAGYVAVAEALSRQPGDPLDCVLAAESPGLDARGKQAFSQLSGRSFAG